MDMNEKVFDLLQATGLNWTVSKEPLISSVDQSPTKSFGIFKKIDRKHLSTVGSVYEPYQNSQLAEAMLIAADGLGLSVTNGGQLFDGKKVFLQMELPEVFIGNSGVKRNLTGLNSHDGSTSIGFGSSNTVVVCQNTFFMAYGDLNKVRHCMNAEERIKAMAKDLNIALLRDGKLMDSFKQMAEVNLNEELLEKTIRNIFGVELSTKQSDLSKRKLNQIDAFKNAVVKELDLEGPTVWGLFNGVTRFTNHVLAPENKDKKLDFLMDGRGYEISNKTYTMLAKELGIAQSNLSVAV